MEITHNNLPEAVLQILQRLDGIERLINKTESLDTDKPITIEEVSNLSKLSVATIYGYVSRNEIPFSKRPNSKRLWFSKSEILNWLLQGKQISNTELLANASEYLSQKNKK